MDNSELHYVTYDTDAMWAEMMSAYIDAGGDVLYGGDEKEMLLRAQLNIAELLLAGVDNALRMATLRYAQGEYLDLYGEKRSCYRLAAQYAQGTVKIIFIANGVQKTIPAGTALTADGKMVYLLTEDVTQTGNARTVTAGIVCQTAGAAGNTLAGGTTMQFVNTESGVESVTCTGGASGGSDEEEDEAYRERIRRHGLTTTTTGTEDAYEQTALDATADILDAKAVKTDDEQVTVYILAAEGADGSEAAETALNALEDKSKRPLTVEMACEEAEDVPYELNVVYSAEETASSNLTAAIEEAAEEYQKWQDYKIGRAFNPDRLVAYLYRAGAMNVRFAERSHFNGDEVEYTEITSAQRCKGTITLYRTEA